MSREDGKRAEAAQETRALSRVLRSVNFPNRGFMIKRKAGFAADALASLAALPGVGNSCQQADCLDCEVLIHINARLRNWHTIHVRLALEAGDREIGGIQ